MSKVFLSYASENFHFADLAAATLADADIELWRDNGQLIAGTDWREGIERGISSSLAVLVALSPDSAKSSYVTYEWAYALGKGKHIIPLMIKKCRVHPRLEVLQHFDFSVQLAQPWGPLIDRIRSLEIEAKAAPTLRSADLSALHAYWNRQGRQQLL